MGRSAYVGARAHGRRFSLLASLVSILAACAGPLGGAPRLLHTSEQRGRLEPPIRVLLLGDSISLGYTESVISGLGEDAEVVRPLRANGRDYLNCQGTNCATANLDGWLDVLGEDFDVVHFNFGLHDLKRVHPATGENSGDPSHPHQASPASYRRQLRAVAERLRATDARLVFALTTPIPPHPDGPYREPEDAVVYNAIAREVMGELEIPVNDLYSFALERLEAIQKPDDVHFSAEGSRVLGAEVVRAIRARAAWK
jgi:hypothetical protein